MRVWEGKLEFAATDGIAFSLWIGESGIELQIMFSTVCIIGFALEWIISREESRQSIFEYIEVFYNRSWRHSALGSISPEQFEQAA